MKYSVLLLFMIVACSVPESTTSKSAAIPRMPNIYYADYNSLSGTTWQTSDKTVTVIFSGNQTAQVTCDDTTYTLTQTSYSEGIFNFESATQGTDENYWTFILVLSPCSQTEFFYQLYAGNQTKKNGQLTKVSSFK